MRHQSFSHQEGHYSKGDAYENFVRGVNAPARYGAVDWDQETGSVTPIANPNESLISSAELERRIDEALARTAETII